MLLYCTISRVMDAVVQIEIELDSHQESHLA